MKYIAHRGKTTDALENTIEAFLAAAQDPHYIGIECDLRTSSDYEFIIFHDDSTKRLSDKDQLIADLTYDEIKSLILYDEKKKTYAIPHIIEYLNICKSYEKRPIIEIKKIHEISLLQNLLSLLDDYLMIEPIIISYDMNYLKYIRAFSMIELFIITNQVDENLIYDCRVNEINFNIDEVSVDKDIIENLRKKGFKTAVFTVNDKERAAIYEALKIDFLTTDKL